jgi:hypothetical protein
MITKAKIEYYESELAKKEQEIINLLDLKKDELRTSDSKSDFETVLFYFYFRIKIFVL